MHFYGERHTDGGLIEENMRRLAADMRPGRPAIVLVEGYTGPDLRAALGGRTYWASKPPDSPR